MNRLCKVLAIAALAALGLAWPAAARADDDNDHDLARELHEHGEIHALKDVLRKLAADRPGDVVAIDLIRVGAKWIYRFQVVAPDGQRSVVDIDAGAMVEIEEAGERP